MNFLTNANGENIGHVEVMQDVTKTIRQQKYQAGEFKRLSSNLKNLSVGSLDLDLNVTEADDYTKEMSQGIPERQQGPDAGHGGHLLDGERCGFAGGRRHHG